MNILGIETSCDETGVAIYAVADSDVAVDNAPNSGRLLANVLYSQIPLHAKFGGVVPELASRDHIRKTTPLIQETLAAANLNIRDINTIAYTAGPGLAGALLVGAGIGQSLGFALNVPTIAVHHMEAHLLAVFLEENIVHNDGEPSAPTLQPHSPPQHPRFPFLALLVSGGHTQLVQVDNIGKYRLLGETLDDAAGEAFDKVAKILGLPYPGGAALSALAIKGNPLRFYFPRPMVNRPGLDFSFSGLKTFALNTLRNAATAAENKNLSRTLGGKENKNTIDSAASNELDKGDDANGFEQTRADIARAFQDAIVDTLAIKCRRALQQTKLNQLVLAGGVSANQALREKLRQMTKKEGATLYCPHPKFCTDNGAMIAYAGYRYLLCGKQNIDHAINIFPRWKMPE